MALFTPLIYVVKQAPIWSLCLPGGDLRRPGHVEGHAGGGEVLEGGQHLLAQLGAVGEGVEVEPLGGGKERGIELAGLLQLE